MPIPISDRAARHSRAAAGAVVALVLSCAAGLVSGSAYADGTRPYGDSVTGHVADRLHGTDRGAWLATVLDINGYHGRRHAEVVRVKGQPRRWIGIIHVPAGKGQAVMAALNPTMWLARKGNAFVLPLKSQTNTDGSATWREYRTARWAARRLGAGWRVPE